MVGIFISHSSELLNGVYLLVFAVKSGVVTIHIVVRGGQIIIIFYQVYCIIVFSKIIKYLKYIYIYI